MAKKYVENKGDSPMWVGGLMIMPGEGREVEVPDEAPQEVAEPEPDPDADLRELLAGNVAAVKASLDGLGADSIKRLRDLEAAAEKPRKGVLDALDVAAIAAAEKSLDLKSDSL